MKYVLALVAAFIGTNFAIANETLSNQFQFVAGRFSQNTHFFHAEEFRFDPQIFHYGVSDVVSSFKEELREIGLSCSDKVAVGNFLVRELAEIADDPALSEQLFSMADADKLITIVKNYSDSGSCSAWRFKIFFTDGRGLVIDAR